MVEVVQKTADVFGVSRDSNPISYVERDMWTTNCWKT